MFTKYQVTLTLTRPMLGTNPIDPNIHDQHILNRQRELITENSGVNKEINKYLDQLQISAERGGKETESLIDKLEELFGREFTAEERKQAIKGELAGLRETLAEQELKGTTVFFRDEETGLPCIGDHMIKGHMKAAGEAISRTLPKKNGAMLHSASYTSSVINQHVTIDPMFIVSDQDIVRHADGSAKYLQRSLRAMTAQGPRVSLTKSEQIAAGAKLQFTLKVLDDSPLTEEIIRRLLTYGEISGLGQWRNSGYGQFSFELKKA